MLYLWNLATRTLSNKIVFSDEEDESDYLLTRRDFAFSYDNSTDTYKIVAFDDNNKMRIFNVGEDSVWRNIQSFPLVSLETSDFFHMNHDLATNCGVYVSGTIN